MRDQIAVSENITSCFTACPGVSKTDSPQGSFYKFQVKCYKLHQPITFNLQCVSLADPFVRRGSRQAVKDNHLYYSGQCV